MKTLYRSSTEDVSRLIIIFLGWGFPIESFADLHKRGYHIMLVSDYRQRDWDLLEAEIRKHAQKNSFYSDEMNRPSFREYVIIGWSFGVRMATEFIDSCTLSNITLRLAVNGTVRHIDDCFGIPSKIFDGTLEGLTPQTLSKFRLRSAGSKQMLEQLIPADAESIDIEALRQELSMFGSIPRQYRPNRFFSCWDRAIIGLNDRIFPPDNQRAEWAEIDIYQEPEMAHVPDFQYILDHYIVDKCKISSKFQNAGESYTANATVQQRVAERLLELLPPFSYGLGHERILELGYGDGTLTRLYLPNAQNSVIDAYDIAPAAETMKRIERLAAENGNTVNFLTEDVEAVDSFPGRYDLILSSSMLQWLNSPQQLLLKCSKAAYPHTVTKMAFSFYGAGTLKEVSDITGNTLKYPSMQSLTTLAQRIGLEVLKAEEETIVLTFPTPAEALRHLKLTGVNALSKAATPAQIRRLIAQWPRNTAGEATLTFECKYLILAYPD